MIKNYNFSQLKHIVQSIYFFKADIFQLGGYTDRNYLLTNLSFGRQKYILKISNSSQHQNLIKIQNFVLNHLKDHKLLPHCKTPVLKQTHKGQEMIVIQENGLKNYIRVFDFINGKQMWDFKQLPDRIFYQVGQLTANLSIQLQILTQKSEIQSLIKQQDTFSYGMNIMSFKQVYQSKKIFLDLDLIEIIQEVSLDFFKIQHLFRKIPSQILHNDICFSNLLIHSTQTFDTYISGLIDFSSLVYGPRIIQLVMPCARINLQQSQPLKNIFLIIKGYNRFLKLAQQQKIVLYPLIKTRLAFLCLVSCENLALNKENQYIQRCKEGHVKYLKIISKACTNDYFLENLNKL